MPSLQKTVLVLGATGQQGGAVARHLLAKGWHIRALVRDLTTLAARSLHQAGVDLIQGDAEDRTSLDAAIQDTYGVFSIQPAVFGYEREVSQGKNIADAAREASIQHFVHTSMQSADGLARAGSNAISKWAIEQYIHELGLPTTILRPAVFMSDIISEKFGMSGDTFATALNPDVTMRLIAVDDIGAFAALAFEHPNTYRGRTIEIAGDALTPPQIASTISHATGRSITYVPISIETLRQQNMQYARVFDFLNKKVYETDIPALRKLHPGLLDFATWLKKEGKTKLENGTF